jgi:hypothetical protein
MDGITEMALEDADLLVIVYSVTFEPSFRAVDGFRERAKGYQ